MKDEVKKPKKIDVKETLKKIDLKIILNGGEK